MSTVSHNPTNYDYFMKKNNNIGLDLDFSVQFINQPSDSPGLWFDTKYNNNNPVSKSTKARYRKMTGRDLKIKTKRSNQMISNFRNHVAQNVFSTEIMLHKIHTILKEQYQSRRNRNAIFNFRNHVAQNIFVKARKRCWSSNFQFQLIHLSSRNHVAQNNYSFSEMRKNTHYDFNTNTSKTVNELRMKILSAAAAIAQN